MTEPTAPPLSTDDGDKLKKAEFEQNMEEARKAQNLPEGAVPEQRPIASQTVDDPHNPQYHRLKEAGEIEQPAMPKSAYDKAGSDSQMKKAAKEAGDAPERMYPGARGYINKGPREGAAVAVNRVVSFKSFEDQMRGTSGVPEQNNNATVAEYEVTTRDGRAETIVVNAEDITRGDPQHWGRTSLA
jgi:hypothetical protein